jgi:GNAT superfamily N-acetyltransferase
MMNKINLRISPPLTNDTLNRLFAAAWEGHTTRDFQPVLRHSLLYIGAFDGDELIGFVNVAWDGGVHGFLLDTTVHCDHQRRGIGRRLVEAVIAESCERNLEWLHVDYEPHLTTFYESCGFQATDAGLVNLDKTPPTTISRPGAHDDTCASGGGHGMPRPKLNATLEEQATMNRQTARIAFHLLLIAGIVTLMTLCIVYPFLPGTYDKLAVGLSTMTQVFGIVGLMLAAIGVLWLGYEVWRQARLNRNLLAKRRRYAFAVAALAVATIVALAVSIAGVATIGVSVGLLTFVLWVFFAARLLRSMRLLRNEEHPEFNFAPLYLAIVPVAVVLFQLALAAPITQGSRDHAINMSAEIISAIEAYRAANGSYPESLFATYPDYSPNVAGIEQYHYARQGDTYNLSFHQPRFLLDDIGVREFVVYNPADEHTLISHASWILLLSPAELQRSQGWFAVRDAPSAHWKYFWFD